MFLSHDPLFFKTIGVIAGMPSVIKAQLKMGLATFTFIYAILKLSLLTKHPVEIPQFKE
jgi:hypothetical protein